MFVLAIAALALKIGVLVLGGLELTTFEHRL